MRGTLFVSGAVIARTVHVAELSHILTVGFPVPVTSSFKPQSSPRNIHEILEPKGEQSHHIGLRGYTALRKFNRVEGKNKHYF